MDAHLGGHTPASAPSTLGNPENEIGFRIERAVVTGGVTGTYAVVGAALANQTTYVDTPPDPAKSYRYRVVAYNAAGSATSISTGGTPPPSAPSGCNAVPTAYNRVDVSWVDDANDMTGFTLERATDMAFTQNLTTYSMAKTARTKADTAVQPSTTYYYRVFAVTTEPSEWSNTAMVTTPPPPPATPSNLKVLLFGTNYAILSWNDNSNNETGFYIERSLGTTGAFTRIATTGANVVSFRDNGLTTKTTYRYRVQSFNNNGGSPYAGPITMTTR